MEENQGNNQKLNEGMMFLKFLGFSLGAAAIQMASFAVMNELTNWSPWFSYIIAVILSVIYNFTINRRFTFRSVNNIPKAMSFVVLFYALFIPYSAWLMYAMTGATLIDDFGGWYVYAVLFFIMVQNFILEFLWWRFFIFRDSINTRPKKVKQKE